MFKKKYAIWEMMKESNVYNLSDFLRIFKSSCQTWTSQNKQKED